MSKDESKVILVTGASRGVGRGIAEGICKPGDIVYCVGRSLKTGTKVSQFGLELNSSLEDTASEINQLGAKGIPIVADLNREDEIKKISDLITQEHGKLDILVHSACQIHDDLVQPKPFWEKSTELWSMVEVGLKCNYMLTHALAPILIKTSSALVINISSHGAVCYMHGPIYGAQKAGLDKMTHDMAHDFKEYDVCAISLWSGIVLDEKTELISANMDEAYAEFLKGAASQRFAGKVIRGFYETKDKMQKTGKTLIAAELANDLNIKDLDGNQPISDREQLGGPVDFSDSVIY